MSSSLQTYLARSVRRALRSGGKMARMDAAPSSAPLSIFSFDSNRPPVSPVSDFATGSDIDIGGLSTCELMAVPSTTEQSHLSMHGNLSIRVPAEYAGRIRTGYAAMRNRTRPTLFGEETWDLELYTHLKVEVAYRGWETWRTRWVVNLQTDGPVKTDLFQHRLDLPPSKFSTPSPERLDPLHCTGLQFTTLYLPLSSFVLTNAGKTSEKQIEMLQNKIRTIGFALLGGGRDDASAAQTPAAMEAARKGRIMGAGGWGAPGRDEEIDPELEDLLATDRPAGAAPSVQRTTQSPTSSKYHRVGTAEPAPVLPPTETKGTDGYYELCIRSVQAVKYDAEMDDPEGEDM